MTDCSIYHSIILRTKTEHQVTKEKIALVNYLNVENKQEDHDGPIIAHLSAKQ